VSYVDAHKHRFGIEPICVVLTEHGIPIAPSGYHAAKARGVSAADWADAHAANALLDLFTANRSVYGIRKLTAAARRAGLDLGRDQVGRLMKIVGVEGVVRGRHTTVTTRRGESATRHPDLVNRDWHAPTGTDQLWVADFTYVWTLAGFVYVSFVTDVFSRRILGWRVSTSKTTPLVTAALEQALFTRRRGNTRFTSTGLLHHSDAGSQYTSLAFTEALRDANITGSIGSVGDALDNALMESTIGLFKTELINCSPRTWTGRAEVERETAAWVHWFNTTRLHTSIGYLPPIEHEEHHHRQAGAAIPAVA
jgi:transposase InsO family protein